MRRLLYLYPVAFCEGKVSSRPLEIASRSAFLRLARAGLLTWASGVSNSLNLRQNSNGLSPPFLAMGSEFPDVKRWIPQG